MNTNDLKILESVTANGSFTKAAKAMFTVQSNVTARIKNLEEEFNAELFTRTSRKVELTNAGKKLMSYAKQIGQLIEDAKRDLADDIQLIGQLKIGCIETTMALKAPEIISEFTDLYPDIELEFESAMGSALLKDVLNYKLDAAFVTAPITHTDLDQLIIKEEQLVIVANDKVNDIDDWIHGKPVKIVVFDQGCIYRARLESWLSSKGITNYKNIIVNSLEGIVNFVETGLAISILPVDLVEQYYPNRKINKFNISKDLGTSTTVLIYRKNKGQNAILNSFINMYK